MEQLALFFITQRYLCKWGGDVLSTRSPIWHMFRQLFLSTCTLYIAPEYRMEGHYYAQWEQILPHLKDYILLVRAINEHTLYAPEDILSRHYIE